MWFTETIEIQTIHDTTSSQNVHPNLAQIAEIHPTPSSPSTLAKTESTEQSLADRTNAFPNGCDFGG